MNEMPFMNNQMQLDNQGMDALDEYRVVYPEIYYRLQPYIMNFCDQLESTGQAAPSQDMVEQMSDAIFEEIQALYPDLIQYTKGQENMENNQMHDRDQNVIQTQRSFRFRRPIRRRRGLLRDIIEILLLSELGNRRWRRRYY